MQNLFGEYVKARRRDLGMTMRECAVRARIDPGNFSKIERGRLAAPRDEAVLGRLLAVLDYPPGSKGERELRALAAIQNGEIPSGLLADEEVAARLPVLLCALDGTPATAAKLDRLIAMIREA